MDGSWFNETVKPFLKGYAFEYTSFLNGDFGDLERIELEGFNKLGTVGFWSEGWVGMDIYDCALDEQVMNVFFSPGEKESVPQAFEMFVKVLTQDG